MTRWRPTESTEQKTVIDWARNWCRLPGIEMLHMMPNGSCFRRDDFPLWNWLLSMGFEPGLPDLYLDVACGGYFGLRIELKRRHFTPSEVSKKQKDRIDMLQQAGYCVGSCGGAQEAIDLIKWYLSLPPTRAFKEDESDDGK